jgi:nitrite reductase (NADH) small subunit
MSEWKKICRVDDIPVLGSRRVARAQGIDVAVFRNDQDQVFALLDRCPHKGGPLSQGIVFGTSVACPLHNWTIDLDGGCARAPDEGCVQKFSVQGGKRPGAPGCHRAGHAGAGSQPTLAGPGA